MDVYGQTKEMAMPRECFYLIWYSMWCHYFAVATDTITSCSLGKRYGPVFSLSFLDVYDQVTKRVIKFTPKMFYSKGSRSQPKTFWK